MRVILTGWKHTAKYHRIVKHDVSDVQPSKNKIYYRDNVYIESQEPGVRIISGIENLNIHGNFLVQVEFSKNEIINLVRIALANESVESVIRQLVKCSK